MIETIVIILGFIILVYQNRINQKNELIKGLKKEISNTYDYFSSYTEKIKLNDYYKSEIKRHLNTIREHEILLQKLNENEELARDRITIIKSDRNEFKLDSEDLVIVETSTPKVNFRKTKKTKVE